MANDPIEMRSRQTTEEESGEEIMENLEVEAEEESGEENMEYQEVEAQEESDEDFMKELEAAIKSSPSIFRLPESVHSGNPDAFLPLHVALGPYNPKNKMEYYKLYIKNKVRKEFQLPPYDQLHSQLMQLHLKIRVCYDPFLEIESDYLSEIMLVDALFLLRLFRDISNQLQTSPSLTFPLRDIDDILADKMLVSDVVKLENQIPLLVFKTILSNSPNENSLLVFLYHFSKSISPFAFTSGLEISIFSEILNQSHHLLHFTYLTILMAPMHFSTLKGSSRRSFTVTKFFKKWLRILGYVLDIDFIQQINDPLDFIQELFELLGFLQQKTCSNTTPIPSASQLHKLLFKFKPVYEGGILCTKFIKDTRTETQLVPTWNIFKRVDKFFKMVHVPPALYLPVITINANTETLFENLLAFETMANINPPVFARYLRLMKALVLAPKDLIILKNAKIIKTNHDDLENVEQVVKLFNRVGNSIFNMKKPTNDVLNHLYHSYEASTSESESEAKEVIAKVINKKYEKGLKGMVEEINEYYDGFLIVKAKKYVKKCLRCVVKMVAILGIFFQIFLVAKKLATIINVGNVNEPTYQITAT